MWFFWTSHRFQNGHIEQLYLIYLVESRLNGEIDMSVVGFLGDRHVMWTVMDVTVHRVPTVTVPRLELPGNTVPIQENIPKSVLIPQSNSGIMKTTSCGSALMNQSKVAVFASTTPQLMPWTQWTIYLVWSTKQDSRPTIPVDITQYIHFK